MISSSEYLNAKRITKKSAIKWWRGRSGTAFRFASPAIVVFALLLIIPLGYSLYLSFYDLNLSTKPDGEFIGIQNYKDIISDSGVRNAVVVTLKFLVMALPIEMLAGFCIALLLNVGLKGFKTIRTLLLLPLMVTPVISGVIWNSLMFNNEVGLIRYFVSFFGIINPPIWLGDIKWALFSVLAVDFWQQVPFIAIALLAGMQSLPPEQSEASAVDGASSWQHLFYIMVPHLKPVLFVTLFFRFVGLFKVFDCIFTLTRGGPAATTTTIVFYIFKYGYQMLEFSYASAVSVLVLVFIGILGFIIFPRIFPELRTSAKGRLH